MTREIPLSRGLVALVDDDDYEAVVAAGAWHASLCGGDLIYARHSYRDQFDVPRVIYIHNLVMRTRLVDHINGDGLDNRRCNLRPATTTQNLANTAPPSHNTSGYKGVNFYRRTGRYRAYIQSGYRPTHLGYFATAEQAARAYDAAALEHFGEFARLNFPKENAS